MELERPEGHRAAGGLPWDSGRGIDQLGRVPALHGGPRQGRGAADDVRGQDWDAAGPQPPGRRPLSSGV